jgi:hypothetical protein
MKIIHRVTKKLDASMQKQLRELGFEVDIGLATILVNETHPSWPKLQSLMDEWGVTSLPETKFTQRELAGADYLDMGPTWHHTYPLPNDEFEYVYQTYDASRYCKDCHLGLRQQAPFRIKGEPKWGSKHILQLNWVFDEFFVLPEVWERVFQPFGIGCWPVLKHRTGEELKTVVQLRIDAVSPAPLVIPAAHPRIFCPACGNPKYHPQLVGFYPPFTQPVDQDLVWTQEYFGSGGRAFRGVIVSAALYRAIRDAKLKGVCFQPMAPLK